MDLALARTFLAIVEAGSFVGASHRIHVTQSTISARVRTLESLVGRPLFTRNNTSCELTAAGRRFYQYARSLLRVWEEARHQLAVPEHFDDTLSVGGQYSLWEGFLLEWLAQMRSSAPRTALRLSAGTSRALGAELLDGLHDLIVIHAPEMRPGLRVEPLFEDQLILVTTSADGQYRSRYVLLDWGEAFRSMHAEALPDLHTPGLALEMGPIGVEVLLRCQGAGYVPSRIARPLLERGQLFRVSDAPVFLYPAFVACQSDSASRPAIVKAIDIMRKQSAEIEKSQLS